LAATTPTPDACHVGRSDESGVRTQMSRNDPGLSAIPAPNELLAERGAGRLENQIPGGADPTTDDDDSRVEGGGEIGDPQPEPTSDVGNDRDGIGVASLGSGADRDSGDGIGVAAGGIEQAEPQRGAFLGGAATQPTDPIAARVLLPAAAIPAFANAAVGVDHHMAELTGRAADHIVASRRAAE